VRCFVAAVAATVAASTKYCSSRSSHHFLMRYMILTLRIIGCYGCYSNFYWLLQRLLRLLQKATRANYGCYGNSYWLLQWLPRLLRNDRKSCGRAVPPTGCYSGCYETPHERPHQSFNVSGWTDSTGPRRTQKTSEPKGLHASMIVASPGVLEPERLPCKSLLRIEFQITNLD
jgi:hypothetical protein